MGVNNRVVEKSGSWFSYGGERLGQGRENCKQFLHENPDIAAEIEEKIRMALGMIKPQLKEVEGGRSS